MWLQQYITNDNKPEIVQWNETSKIFLKTKEKRLKCRILDLLKFTSNSEAEILHPIYMTSQKSMASFLWYISNFRL